MLLCDGCNQGTHTFCLVPQLTHVPVGAWFCAECAALGACTPPAPTEPAPKRATPQPSPRPKKSHKKGGRARLQPAVGQCERNAFCTRGHKHGGRGGHCNIVLPKHGQCERDLRCVRGLKHCGRGGRCSYTKLPEDETSPPKRAAASSPVQRSGKRGSPPGSTGSPSRSRTGRAAGDCSLAQALSRPSRAAPVRLHSIDRLTPEERLPSSMTRGGLPSHDLVAFRVSERADPSTPAPLMSNVHRPTSTGTSSTPAAPVVSADATATPDRPRSLLIEGLVMTSGGARSALRVEFEATKVVLDLHRRAPPHLQGAKPAGADSAVSGRAGAGAAEAKAHSPPESRRAGRETRSVGSPSDEVATWTAKDGCATWTASYWVRSASAWYRLVAPDASYETCWQLHDGARALVCTAILQCAESAPEASTWTRSSSDVGYAPEASTWTRSSSDVGYVAPEASTWTRSSSDVGYVVFIERLLGSGVHE